MTKDKEKKKIGKDKLLLEAARLGHLQQLDSILSHFQQIESKKKSNPLASLRKIIGPNSVRDTTTGFTCLHHAALNGHFQCVQLILNYGLKPNAVDYKGSSALHLASWAGSLEVVKILLNYGASNSWIDSTSEQEAKDHQFQDQQSPSRQFRRMVDIDLCNNDNQTPLSLAAQFGHIKVVEELIAHGANLHLRNNQLESPLDLACLNGRMETVDLLLKSSPSLVAALQRPRATIMLKDVFLNQSPESMSSQWSGETGGFPPRRPSSGWSTLLRGRRDSNSQSPLHRLTKGTLSMRQKSVGDQEQAGAESWKEEAKNRRRTTLTISAPLDVLTQSKQIAQNETTHWTALDIRNIDNITSAQTNDTSIQGQQPGCIERLLGHSPLQYAIRRGHSNVVNLLLYKYNANILQVTKTGSLLHEIALNNGKHSDMIELLFAYIASLSLSQTNKIELLEKFLNLKNVHQKSVFEVLNEINNRSAQEIKRLIYEFCERLRSQQFTSTLKEPTGRAGQRHLVDDTIASQKQARAQTSQFSDINSFVTMKRVPKKRAVPLGSANGNFVAGCTQTIDHRASARASGQANGHLTNPNHSQNAFMNQNHSQFIAGHILHQPTMTRSVSNLSQVPIHFYDERLGQEPNLMWRRWLSREPSSGQPEQAHLLSSEKQTNICDQKVRGVESVLDVDHLYDNSNQPALLARGYSIDGEHAGTNNMSQLVRSQTDCSHLMGRLFGDQLSLVQLNSSDHQAIQNNNDLDRKTINRGYHVYDHEFYPPRLVADSSQKQLVAVVSPLPHNDLKRASSRYNANGHSSKRNPNEFMNTYLISNECSNNLMLSNESRLSLDTESPIIGQNIEQMNLSRQQRQQQQHQQMDRFLSRYSRKSALAAGPLDSTMEQDPERSVSVDQKRQELMELQQRLMSESMSSQQRAPQHHQMHSSHSLGSYPSEPHLFEMTRQALMHDFDKMIGQELLNRNHRHIIDSKAQRDDGPWPTLTGVSLNMDKYGEQLTVSGTRITMLKDDQTGRARASSKQSLRSSSQNSNELQALDSSGSCALETDAQRASLGNSSIIMTTSHGTQTTSPDLDDAKQHTSPPPKPPRLSLRNKQHKQDLDFKGKPLRPVIYDLPESVTVDKEPALEQQEKRATVCNQTVANCLGSKITRTSITKPPKMRPPPPPESKNFSTPLHVSPSLDQPASSNSSASSNNDLLKVISLTSSSSGSSMSRPSQRYTMSHTLHSSLLADPDSGVCTSNSPASLSHDSESGPTDIKESIDVKSIAKKLERNESSAVVKHSVKSLQRASIGLGEGFKLARAPEGDKLSPQQTIAPPSPKSAQLCIEEALKPLARIPSKTDVTTSPVLTVPSRLTHSYSVDRWLVTSPSDGKELKTESDYENCENLQRQLKKTRCCSINNLFRDNVDSDEQIDPVYLPNNLDPSLTVDSEDDDYATETVSEETTSTSNDSMKAGELVKDYNDNVTDQKEVLLKVVIDQTVHDPNDGEVFYINPLELTKLGTKRTTCSDAETLTDEELCASIDKNSGYIRFTLRRRKNSPQASMEEDTNQSEVIEVGRVSLKKTKLEGSNCNYLGAQTDQLLTSNEANPERQQVDTKELVRGEPSVGVISVVINKQASNYLRQWFNSKLVGLADYLDRFIQNGLDNIDFMNHPQLLNDELLKKIGIDNESHRLLIVERVVNELALVNLEELATLVTDRHKTTLSEALGLLQIEVKCNNEDLLNQKATEVTQIESLNLSIGYRARLKALLNLVNQKSKLVLIQQKSVDSLEVDLNQGSAASSSSKESITSVVSIGPLKLDKPEPDVPSSNLYFDEPKLGTDKETEIAPKQNDKELKFIRTVQVKNKAGSLVSEAARKLEALEAKKNRPTMKPVPAIRRINKLPTSSHADADLSAMEATNKKQDGGPMPLSVKTICWPPKVNLSENDEKRTVLEKSFEEKSDSANTVQLETQQVSNKLRPKPAPPKKPATLANKFIVDVGHRL